MNARNGTEHELAVGGERFRIHRIAGLAPATMPYSLRIVLENLLRHGVPADQVEALLAWDGTGTATAVDLNPSRIFLHDTNGVPALADLAAMRDAVAARGGDPARVNPLIPAELVVDHSVIVDHFGRPDALALNTEREYERNGERYRFLKWAEVAFDSFAVVPPGTGIMHQVNLERLARVVEARDGWAFPDLCLGTDSHTTMVNGLGVLGWGVGGIEAEAAMLGEPVSIPLPRVVGVRLTGALPPGSTATDLVLHLTELMRGRGVVGKFTEFSGPGVAALGVPDRATIANMSPEFGSTCAYFPIDAETIRYLRFTGRPKSQVELIAAYAKAQGLWHDPERPPRYAETLDLDLGTVVPSLAGPRRPQDRVRLDRARGRFRESLDRPSRPTTVNIGGDVSSIDNGAVAIAAITSCTNTSNPAVMVAAGLLARNADRRGLRPKPWVKTSLSPGSRVVADYLAKAGLTPHLDALGFHLTGFGCMTCIGASGGLIPAVSRAVREGDLSVAAVLSGNRNFEGRINPEVRMNFLASPPLVVAYALAGTMDADLAAEPLGTDAEGAPVFLADLWPSPEEVNAVIAEAVDPGMFAEAYADVFGGDERWRSLDAPEGAVFAWDAASDYLRRPPYLDGLPAEPEPVGDIAGARVLLHLGDTATTDHMSPPGAIGADTVAGRYLHDRGVPERAFNTYASRRGNHEVMVRGAFANVRLRNRLAPGTEGGWTVRDGEAATVFDAAAAYREAGVPLIVLAGREYGTGSSRDWAAKGPALLGVKAVIAESFERIHRSNLVGMGVLPLQFLPGESAETLGLTGFETYTVTGIGETTATVRADGREFRVTVRLDTPREVAYHRHGGIMPYVLRTRFSR
ncbi:aconitate hydratase AcnA [Glycomyces mayteni]|uniref:Aconitate hydratase n=1 Tax=Glycomyces mayteni TaxID=543887 RepID=A0ABW2DC11_9ACTN|nr:aconitate hydratase AcnA [Glycomyces mayteni]